MIAVRNEVQTEPFPHIVIDDAFPEGLVRAVDVTWPIESWPHWHRYDDENARKRATKDAFRITPAAMEVLRLMNALPVGEMFGIDGLFPDFDFHGAGMHAMPSGGFLSIHLDCEQHPQTLWRRRLSAVLFVNEQWDASWGGELELTGAPVHKTVRIQPRFNRLAVFECVVNAYHGVAAPLKCPAGWLRKTLASFYWSVPSRLVRSQTKAQFFL